jgi:hypothetical protein
MVRMNGADEVAAALTDLLPPDNLPANSEYCGRIGSGEEMLALA